jgi:hypothetical protein
MIPEFHAAPPCATLGRAASGCANFLSCKFVTYFPLQSGERIEPFQYSNLALSFLFVINKGMIEAPGFYQNKALWCRCKWIGPGRGWIDPVKEAKASKIRLEIGLSTLEDECATQGLDWEEVLEQRAREQTKMTSANKISPCFHQRCAC